MQKTQKRKIKTVSEKVAELILHPNGEYDGSSNESGSEADETKPKIIQFDDDYELPDSRTTEIRKQNIKFLSEQNAKYRGKISSRKDLELEESDSSESDEENEDGGMTPKMFNMKLPDKDLESNDDDIDSDFEEESDGGDHSDNSDAEENVPETDILGKTNRHAEIQKGECVKNQLNIWEKLLEIRIHSQKLLSKANLLPKPEHLQNEQKNNADIRRSTKETEESCVNLLNHLLQLQNSLYNQFSEVKSSCVQGKHKRSLPLTDKKSEAPPSKRFAQHLDQRFNDFKPYRNSVLLKWDDRTKLLTPGAGSKKKSLQEEFDILKKIENGMLNRKSHIFGSQTEDATDAESGFNTEGNENILRSVPKPHVYDDSEFYHQQLRELIEYKSSGSTNATDVTKQLIELQKLRQKMKKKVDTRASKGRKIRYNVHKKLINFMAPHDASNWTEESKNELSKSLFSS